MPKSSTLRASRGDFAGGVGHLGIETAAAINTGVGMVRELNTDVRKGGGERPQGRSWS